MHLRQLPLALTSVLSGTLVAGCGLADLFKSADVTDVVVTYTGPTTIRVGDSLPLQLTVSIAGKPIPNPRLAVTSDDPAIIALSADHDSLFARSRGFDTLTIRLVGSIYTDSFPTIRQGIKVNP